MPGRRGLLALTGATGFIGAQCATQAVANGWRVRALARRPRSLPEGVEPLEGALEDHRTLARLCADADAVVHCAGAIRARSATDFHAVNAQAVERLARRAAEAGVQRFIHLSSLAARQPNVSRYAASKRAGERVLEGGDYPFAWTILRPPAVYGPGDRATLPIFQLAARGMLVAPRREGMRVSLIQVEDLVRLTLALAEGGDGAGRIVEPDDGAPDGHGWDEIAQTAAHAAGRRSLRRLSVPFGLARAFAVLGSGLAVGRAPVLSVDKVREVFHPDWVCKDGGALSFWRAETPIAEGFRRAYVWYREQGWL